MATREENLKKINVELEQLSDEELEKVAGGGFMDILKVIAEKDKKVAEFIEKQKQILKLI